MPMVTMDIPTPTAIITTTTATHTVRMITMSTPMALR